MAKKAANTTKEKAKRLPHTIPVIRQLFAHSGNLCAFPGCAELMISAKGKPIGQICHIEGVAGERHNPNMSDEERAAVENLMLMCYSHHMETNDVKKYTVEVLKRMKAKHEKKFSHPERVIVEALSDSTDREQLKLPANLNRMNRVLKWSLDMSQLEISLETLTHFCSIFKLVPLPTRTFVGEVAKRIHKMRDTGHVKDEPNVVGITFTDLASALHHKGRQVGISYLTRMANDLDGYGVGGYGAHMGDEGEHMLTLVQPDHWGLWDDLIEFSKKEGIAFNDFIVDLDFSSLGE